MTSASLGGSETSAPRRVRRRLRPSMGSRAGQEQVQGGQVRQDAILANVPAGRCGTAPEPGARRVGTAGLLPAAGDHLVDPAESVPHLGSSRHAQWFFSACAVKKQDLFWGINVIRLIRADPGRRITQDTATRHYERLGFAELPRPKPHVSTLLNRLTPATGQTQQVIHCLG
jgi:hypothetical protein